MRMRGRRQCRTKQGRLRLWIRSRSLRNSKCRSQFRSRLLLPLLKMRRCRPLLKPLPLLGWESRRNRCADIIIHSLKHSLDHQPAYNFELFYVIHVFYVYEQFQATSKQGVYVSGERRRMSLFICKATTTTTTTTVARMSALEN